MGMFLSQFSMLKAMGYGEDRHIREETEKILEPFKLFALVLHDPKKHTSFHFKFSQLFERLDYLTGPNLLFMGIAKPTYDWYSRNKNRDYFGIWEKDELLRSIQEIKGGEGSITCYAIGRALNIDYDDLPCLIISPGLGSSSFCVLKTGKDLIEKQLTELGYFASSVENKVNIYSEQFKLIIRSIDFYHQSELINHQEPLGTSLADTFSFSVLKNSHFGNDAEKHARLVFRKLKNRISKSDNVDEIENVKMNLLSNLASKYKTSINPLIKEDEDYSPAVSDEGLFIKEVYCLKKSNSIESLLYYLENNKEWLEPESNIIVSTTDAVYSMFKESANKESLDFSPLVLGFSKIFEIETNLSVVHWVRKYLKIKMPDYYKKYSPECQDATILPEESIVSNPKKIDFNMHKGAKWKAPGIGQSELAVRSLFKNNNLIESFSKEEESNLIDVWTPIRELRNSAAHSEIMRSADLEKIAVNMNLLSTSKNLKKILDLKNQYKGVKTEINKQD